MNAPGDFAQAYVIAHEVGHHVQNLLGISDQVHAAKREVSEKDYNLLSVRLELQADCLAGVWAHHADRSRQVVEPGDIDEALNAASQIGDDRLQQQSRGYVAPDSFTHGTSEQRARWFKQGYTRGEFNSYDTFAAKPLSAARAGNSMEPFVIALFALIAAPIVWIIGQRELPQVDLRK